MKILKNLKTKLLSFFEIKINNEKLIAIKELLKADMFIKNFTKMELLKIDNAIYEYSSSIKSSIKKDKVTIIKELLRADEIASKFTNDELNKINKALENYLVSLK